MGSWLRKSRIGSRPQNFPWASNAFAQLPGPCRVHGFGPRRPSLEAHPCAAYRADEAHQSTAGVWLTPVCLLRATQVQDEELLNDAATAAATESNKLVDLMYSDLDLRCHTRRITQAMILQKQIREAMEAFNAEFKAMVDRKIKDTDRIADLNARIEERARELFKVDPE